MAALLSEMSEQRRQPGVVDCSVAGQLDAAADVSPSLDEVDRQPALVDGSGLADVGVVEPDEVGALAGDVGEQHLVADEPIGRCGDQLVEVGLVVAGRAVRARCALAHRTTGHRCERASGHPRPAWPGNAMTAHATPQS
jgi:hypothetical protein